MCRVNREDRLSAFSIYQAKRLSYPIVHQSYRIVRESCSIARVFYRIVRLSYPIVYLVKNNVAGTVIIVNHCYVTLLWRKKSKSLSIIMQTWLN